MSVTERERLPTPIFAAVGIGMAAGGAAALTVAETVAMAAAAVAGATFGGIAAFGIAAIAAATLAVADIINCISLSVHSPSDGCYYGVATVVDLLALACLITAVVVALTGIGLPIAAGIGGAGFLLLAGRGCLHLWKSNSRPPFHETAFLVAVESLELSGEEDAMFSIFNRCDQTDDQKIAMQWLSAYEAGKPTPTAELSKNASQDLQDAVQILKALCAYKEYETADETQKQTKLTALEPLYNLLEDGTSLKAGLQKKIPSLNEAE